MTCVITHQFIIVRHKYRNELYLTKLTFHSVTLKPDWSSSFLTAEKRFCFK